MEINCLLLWLRFNSDIKMLGVFFIPLQFLVGSEFSPDMKMWEATT